jgi:signal transduction histidine kinase
MRIRSRLLLLTLAILVPAFFGSAIAVAYVFQEQQAIVRDNLRETARALALVLDKELATREAVLRTLAASPALAQGDLKAFYQFAKSVGEKSDAAIILSDPGGAQLVNTRLPFGAPLPPMLPMERQMRAHYGQQATLVSNLYLPPVGQPVHSFAIQIPLQREGKTTHFLTMGSHASQLQSVLEQQRLPPDWHATIIDRAGTVVARSKEPEKYVGKPVREALRTKLSAGEGLHEGVTLGGVAATAFFSRAPSSEWMFLIGVPQSVIQGTAIRATALMAGISLLLLGLAITAALVVSRRTAQPIEALRLAAERLGRNEPVNPQASGIAEMDAVNAAMVQASDRLRAANAELERRVAEALSGYERSQRALVQAQKLEALGRLSGGIAHDFNNVLQTLTTGLQAATQGAPDNLRKLLVTCQRAVARGSKLTRELMAFGRVQDVRVESVNLVVWLNRIQPLMAGMLPSNINFETDLGPQLWPVRVDPVQLELALLNLVMNARDAMPRGGSVVLRVGNETVRTSSTELEAGDYVALVLSDTGEGMTDDVIARAFDPFFTTKSAGKGSGMGLAQAYGFARQAGGALSLQSRAGHGTTATLHLPRAEQAAASAEPEALAPPRPRARSKVLLVEDDALVRETVSAALDASGFDVSTASSGDEALQMLDNGASFDVVFSDVVMPGTLSGLDLAEVIAQRWPGTRMVIATGYADRGIDQPGVRALPKPYGLQQAVDALNEAANG